MSSRLLVLLVLLLLGGAVALAVWMFSAEQPAVVAQDENDKADDEHTAPDEQDETTTPTAVTPRDEANDDDTVPGDDNDRVVPEETDPEESAGVLEGRVLDEEGEPVAAVTVLFSEWWNESMRDPLSFGPERGLIRSRTDEQGRFALSWPLEWEGSTSGHVLVTAPTILEVVGKPVEFGSLEPVEFVVQRAPALRVRVLTPSGEPVADADVAALHTREPVDEALTADPRMALRIGVMSRGRERQGRADEHGIAEIGPLREPERATHVGAFAQGYGPSFAANLTVAPTGFTEITLTLTPGETIAGRVVDQYGEPVAACTIHVSAPGTIAQLIGEDLLAQSARSDLDGHFKVRGLVPPIGAFAELGFTVEASTPGHSSVTLERIPPGESALLIELHRYPVIAVDVRMPNGEPLPAQDWVYFRAETETAEGVAQRHWLNDELFLVNEAGQALNRDGEPDPRYEQPGTGFYGRLERDLAEGERWMRRLVGVAPGTYTIEAEHDVYATARASGIVVGETDRRRDIMIVFRPAAGLSGIVRGPDGEPLAGARLQASDFDPNVTLEEIEDELRDFSWNATTWRNTTRTNDDGEFRFASMPAGPVHLLVAAPGLAPHERTLTLDADSTSEIEIVLAAGMEIRGRIRLADGSPAESASLSVQHHFEPRDYWLHSRWLYSRDRVYERVEEVARTVEVDHDEDPGRFVVRGLLPRTYLLSAEAPGGTSGAEVFEAGTHDAEIVLGTLAEIVGTITHHDGSPVRRGRLLTDFESFSLEQQGYDTFTYDREDGRFRLLVSPGEQVLVVHSEGYVSDSARVVATVRTPAHVALVLDEPRELTVFVRDAAGEPILHATVEAEAHGAFRYRSPQLPAGQLTDEQGRARLTDILLPTLTLKVTYESLAPSYVDVNLRNTDEVHVRLTGGGRIEGRMVRGEAQPLADVAVEMWRAFSHVGTTRTDDNGRFTFEQLTPGTYTLSLTAGRVVLYETVIVLDGKTTRLFRNFGEAIPVTIRTTMGGRPVSASFVIASEIQWSNGATDATGTFEAMLLPGSYEMYAISVTNVPGLLDSQWFSVPAGVDAHDVTLEFPTGSIVGTVRDAEGNPLRRTTIRAVRVDAQHDSHAPAFAALWSHTDSHGRFTIDGLHGTYQVWVTTPGGEVDRVEVEVSAGEIAEVELAVREGGRLRVRIADVTLATSGDAHIVVFDADSVLVPAIYMLPDDGELTLSALVPGRYTVRTTVPGYAQCYDSVHVEMGQTSELVVRPQPTARLYLHPIDAQGRPTQQVKLSVTDEQGRDVTPLPMMVAYRYRDGETNPPALEVLGLGSGTYTITLTSTTDATTSAARTLDLQSGQTHEATLRLTE